MGNKLIAACAAFMATVFMSGVQAGEKEVVEAIKGKIRGADGAEVRPAPVPGLFEVVANGQIYYVTEDGKYLLQGTAFDLVNGTDLTEPRMNEIRAKALKGIAKDQAITYSPKGEVKDRITVFTDIDCYYCQKMHQQMEGYLAEGIEVRYMFYPRAGLNSASARKAEAVWCADDKLDAMTHAKADPKGMSNVEMRRCENPVAAHYNLGKDVGVRATPTLLTDKGQVVPGYRKPSDLRKILNAL